MSRKARIPIVFWNVFTYSIYCPQCKKPITLQELENISYCSICDSYWNKYAKSLLDFYSHFSPKLEEQTLLFIERYKNE